MAAQGRLGDQATGTHQGSDATGPAQQGASATFVNGQPALRVGDTGDHDNNSGDWRATQGSSSVFIEGRPAHRLGDATSHDSTGQLAQGSGDTDVGTGNGGSTERPHDLELTVEVRDATDRKIKHCHIKTECPHPGAPNATPAKAATPTKAKNGKGKPAAPPSDAGLVAFDEQTKVSGLCTAAPITIYKSLERGDWDAGAKSGAALPHAQAASKDGGTMWFHSPAPESKVDIDVKTAAEWQIPIPKASTPKAVVRMTTAYNWMELVYKAFKLTMPTGANEAAVLGVREGVINGGQRTTRDDDFENYSDHVKKGGKGDGGHMTKYDDLVFLAIAPTDPAVMQRVEAMECSIDPGELQDANTPGMTLLLEGGKDGAPIYKGYPGTHHGPCLHLYSASTTTLKVTRIHYEPVTDKNVKTPPANHRTFETIGDANVRTGAKKYLFYSEEGDPGILIHSTWTQEYVNSRGVKWSTGCTVIRHSYDHGGDDQKRYLAFGTTATTAANKSKVPYLVVSSKYVKSYAEWVKEVDKNPDQVPKPSSVLRKDGLETPTNGAKGKYLPSFISKAFADEVYKQYADLQKKMEAGPPAPPGKGELNMTEIQNLKTSLDACLFEVDES